MERRQVGRAAILFWPVLLHPFSNEKFLDSTRSQQVATLLRMIVYKKVFWFPRVLAGKRKQESVSRFFSGLCFGERLLCLVFKKKFFGLPKIPPPFWMQFFSMSPTLERLLSLRKLSAALLGCGMLAWTQLFAANPPNIVLIISDDQAWSDYSFMGHAVVKTPQLDRLSQESVLFRRGYVPTALCRPSLMSLATGHYAHRHGVTGNDPSPKHAPPNSALYKQQRAELIARLEQFETLPKLLAERGYWSYQSGKWWEGSHSHGGFTHGMTRGFPKPGGRHGDDGLKIGRQGMQPIADFVKMATNEGKPFFLWYAPFLPHTPHNPPERLFQKYKNIVESIHIERYYAMCEWFDETCGALMNILNGNGVRENTLIIYVTDNGWIQHPSRRGYAPRSKQTPYEGGVRTPIFFHWPGKLAPADRSEVVSSIDIFPTILAVAGARTPQKLPGINLLPHLKSGAKIDRRYILGEGFAHDIANIKKPEASLLYRWTIEGKWKLLLTYDGEVNRYHATHPRTEKRPQLFDLIADPAEQHNLAGQYPDIVSHLAKNIASWYPVRERRVKVKFE